MNHRDSAQTSDLVCAPSPLTFEAPASWVGRLALSQLVDPTDIMLFLGVDRLKDPDVAFTQTVAQTAARTCRLKFSSFRFMRRILVSLRLVGVSPETFLMSVDGFAQYRFCKICLREQREKYFPFHWRFKAWRWCPDHQSLMHERRPHCHSLVVLPAGLFRAAAFRKTSGSLDKCMVCGKTLWAKTPPRRFDATRNFLTPWERHLIANGRALLAALWRRKVILEKDKLTYERGICELAKLARSGLLPHGPLHFEKYESLPKRYRHPLTQQIVDESRTPVSRNQWVGLFD